MYRPNLKSVSLPVPETAIGFYFLGTVGVVNPQSWGRGNRRGSGMVKALHSNFSSIFTHFRDITAPRLPKISPCSVSRWVDFGL